MLAVCMSATAGKGSERFRIPAKIGAVFRIRSSHTATGFMRTFLRLCRRFRHGKPPRPSALPERHSSMQGGMAPIRQTDLHNFSSSQPVWPQSHSSVVRSLESSQKVEQYLDPGAATQLQAVCAHLLLSDMMSPRSMRATLPRR